jgi:signal transduction histidine kinase
MKLKKGLTSKSKRLEKDLAYVTQEMYRRNLELAEINNTLSLLRKIDSLTLESHASLDSLCQSIADAVIELSPYSFVGIVTVSHPNEQMELLGYAASFDLPEAFRPHKVNLKVHTIWAASATQLEVLNLKALTNRQLAHILGLTEKQAVAVRQAAQPVTTVAVKLISQDRVIGTMIVGLPHEATELTEKERNFAIRLCQAVGVALDNRLLFEQNQHVLSQLQKTNAKLKALDATKDDFISMASHQLRTPLTSVKGYLSMVLEGDAGKVTTLQRKMLEQAFTSSQRMTYLISDLLNVSRLKTGKFVIERTPTNLVTMVEQELAQLTEEAKGRDLTLIFTPPKDFPALMLDETKTRQLIMNFVDNAIYYTPPGGTVEIKVADKPDSVELTVVDNGLGVPRRDQAHLFTKFYRANNARKARPDGTGLGLFMAKKVVIAQGGAIIFSSQENKGSTFGFTFPKTSELTRLSK